MIKVYMMIRPRKCEALDKDGIPGWNTGKLQTQHFNFAIYILTNIWENLFEANIKKKLYIYFF